MRVFTDGACSGNPGPGGWAWVTDDGRSASGGAANTTNQRMEVQAVLEALRALDGRLEIHSDSTYVVNCFNDKWYEGWKARGWKNASKKPVANRDLWEPLIDLYLSRQDELSFTWVKAHAGEELNEVADAMAVAAAEREKEQLATAVDEIESTWPADRTIWFVGATEIDRDQVAAIRSAIESLEPGRDVVLSGLRRGAELEAAERAVVAGLSLAVVLPFVDPASGWPSDLRVRFDDLVDRADYLATLEGNRSAPGAAVERRNRWTASTVVGAVVVGDDDLADRLDEVGLTVIRH